MFSLTLLGCFLPMNPSTRAAPRAVVAIFAPLGPNQGLGSFRDLIAAWAPAVNAVRAPACTRGFCHHWLHDLVEAGIDVRLLVESRPRWVGGPPRVGDGPDGALLRRSPVCERWRLRRVALYSSSSPLSICREPRPRDRSFGGEARV